jgi:hypothetical protein
MRAYFVNEYICQVKCCFTSRFQKFKHPFIRKRPAKRFLHILIFLHRWSFFFFEMLTWDWRRVEFSQSETDGAWNLQPRPRVFLVPGASPRPCDVAQGEHPLRLAAKVQPLRHLHRTHHYWNTRMQTLTGTESKLNTPQSNCLSADGGRKQG